MALETSLISNWRLNGDSADNKGANNGTDTNVTYVTGRKGLQCASFDGTGDFITVDTTGFPTGANAVSVAVWFKTTSADTSNMIFSYGTGASEQGLFIGHGIVNAGKMTVSIFGDSTTDPDTSNNGAWHFCVITGTGTNYNIYIDGVLKIGPDAQTTDLTSGNGRIGRDFTETANDYNGQLQDLSLWAKEVTGAEVTLLWNNGNGMYFDGTSFVSYSVEGNDDFAIII